MIVKEILAELQSLGNEKMMDINTKAGAGKNQFGVKMGDIRIQWLKSKNKWALRAGWSLMAGKIARDADGLDMDALLKQLQKEMPKAVPEVQWTMNFALAYIGIHHPAYRKQALSIGEELGIYRDYPVSKGCTSPFAPIWINEMVKRQSK